MASQFIHGRDPNVESGGDPFSRAAGNEASGQARPTVSGVGPHPSSPSVGASDLKRPDIDRYDSLPLMGSDPPALIGVGYEGRSIEGFIQDLRDWQIAVLVDVRLNPISRKPGFSRRSLEEALGHAGIAYIHLRCLGNPRENRAGFGDSSQRTNAREAFKRHIDCPEGREALAQLTDLAATGRVAVMCVEAHEQACHRAVVLDEARRALLGAATPALIVRDSRHAARGSLLARTPDADKGGRGGGP